MAETEDQPGEPALVPLGQVLWTPPDRHGKRMRRVIAAIEGLHRVPAIRPIQVRFTADRNDLGRYVKHSGTGEPLGIEVSLRRNDQVEITFAHEVGHLLESAMIPGSAFGLRDWASDEVFRDWRGTVATTDSYQRLQDMFSAGGERRKFVAYLLRDEELWARSYAQYVASRRQDRTMLEQIQPRRFPQYPYPIQWSDREFESIAASIENLFNRIGWRR